MKKSILLIAVFFSFQLLVNAQTSLQTAVSAENENTIEVIMEGFESNEGTVYIGLYNEEGKWLSKRYKKSKEKIENLKAATVFTDVPPGIYAISIFHDVNDNKELDANFFGIPSEPYACSNGAVGRFGPPTWEDAKFTLDGNKKVVNIKF